jgi:uncharacterized protein with FMN-binding domain
MLDKAKKIVLSVSVIVLFALYSVQQRTHSPTELAAILSDPTATSTPRAVITIPAGAQARNEPARTPTATTAAGRQTALKTPTPVSTDTPAVQGAYLDGSYTGDAADANWGNVQVEIDVSGGQISNVQFLEFPNHRNRSKEINQRANPILIQEAIQAQNAEVDVVSGATDTSDAFIQSLASALQQAAR